jgi:hypothetical protein
MKVLAHKYFTDFPYCSVTLQVVSESSLYLHQKTMFSFDHAVHLHWAIIATVFT